MNPLPSSSLLPLFSLLLTFCLLFSSFVRSLNFLPFPVTPSGCLMTHPVSLYFYFHSSWTFTTHLKNLCFQFLFSSLPCLTSSLQSLLSLPFLITVLPLSIHFTDPCFHFLFSSPPFPHLPSPAHITTPLHSPPLSSFPLPFSPP